eukprot:TRINITY_DN32500_c0_g1_i1.p1 TRINITY_DN32500_c0_g1~~TRINITY_DN32500_c0_g1_i1.p1  ORF type:complete len:165 (+),score=39.12 TRINITY_DN32500_c0_g1_i1:479-973(+)
MVMAEEVNKPQAEAEAEQLPIYTLEDAKKHTTMKDCWLIINEKVYDVTSFLDDHPGGDEILVSATGEDATEMFEDIGHSKSARKQMEQYCIGRMDVTTLPVKANTKSKPSDGISFGTTTQVNARPNIVVQIIRQLIVPVAFILLAVAISIIMKKDIIPTLPVVE